MEKTLAWAEGECEGFMRTLKPRPSPRPPWRAARRLPPEPTVETRALSVNRFRYKGRRTMVDVVLQQGSVRGVRRANARTRLRNYAEA